MQPVVMILGAVTQGDTWDGFTVGPAPFTNYTPSDDLERVRMYFRHPSSGRVLYKLDSDSTQHRDGNITIDNAVTWTITVDEQILQYLTPGSWFWDLEFTDVNGVVKTLYKGTLFVSPDQSNNLVGSF